MSVRALQNFFIRRAQRRRLALPLRAVRAPNLLDLTSPCVRQETKALLESGMDSTQLAQKLKQLEASREAGDMPMQKIKKCEEYADFAGEFCEVKDDDDIVCASSSLPEKDELTLAALDLVRGSDGNERWPVALSCKHVYNWSTLTEKKPDGSWALSACVVAGCRSGTVPTLLKDRQKLKEDPRVKHALQKKARKRGGRASVDSFDVDEEDD